MKSEPRIKMSPLAITGIGCIFPMAENLDEYWSNIKNRVDAITDIPPTHWKVNEYYDANPKSSDMTYGKRGGFISPIDFDPLEYAIAPNSLEAIDTSQILGLVVAKRALEDAGYVKDRDFNRKKTSVILGVTGTLELVIPLGARLGHPIWRRALKESGADDEFTEKVISRISDSYVEWQESSFPGLLGNVVAGRIANYFDLGGTNCAVDSACASSLSALHLASLELWSGKSDIVLTGGVDTFNDIFMYMCFSKTPALSPTGNAKPFDSSCDGTVLGEGIGMIVLKRLEDARRDGDRIYALIRSIGTSSDGKGAAVFAPRSEGQVEAMLEAYNLGKVSPRTIELVEAHGTGTKVGDITEFTSLKKVYAPSSQENLWCAIGSVKSQIGHTKAAAGIAGLIKSAMGLYYKTLPPTIKIERPLDEILENDTPFYVNIDKRPWIKTGDEPRRAAVSSFGFGGSNFHCILEEAESSKKRIDWDGTVQIFALSDNDINSLSKRLESIVSNCHTSWKELSSIAVNTRSSFKPEHRYRMVFVLEKDNPEPERVLRNALAMLCKSQNKQSWSTPDGAYFGEGTPGKLCFLFPGQGSQYTDMLRDMMCLFPEMHVALNDATESFKISEGNDSKKHLSEYIYPKPTFSKKADAEDELRDTRIAQPAIGAVSLGAAMTLEFFGIVPDVSAGHSYGELTALCVSGRISQKDLFRLSALRGRLMAEQDGDLGSMLAVQSDNATLEKIIKESGLNLVIANKNAPNQTVLSGLTEEIEKAAKHLSNLGIKNTKLPVAAAFHSPIVASAQKPFKEALSKTSMKKAHLSVFSNTTGQEYPESEAKAKDLLSEQLANPVQFVDEIVNIYNTGARTFLEVGPGARLTGLVKSILHSHNDFETVSIDSSQGKRNGIADLARAISCIASIGHRVEIEKWNPISEYDKREAERPKNRMTIPICGANHVNTMRKKGNGYNEQNQSENNNLPKQNNSNNPEIPDSGTRNAAGKAVNSQNENTSLELLKITQENIRALQNIQEQTAKMHEMFLQNQDNALKAFQDLAQKQQALFQSATGKTSWKAPPENTPQVQAKTSEQNEIPAVKRNDNSLKKSKDAVIELVSQKTGYPEEMLDLDMTLDSDLGIDSIKRVEIFSALKDKMPDIPQIKSEHMGNLRTLRNIVDFISQSSCMEENSKGSASSEDNNSAGVNQVSNTIIRLISEKTGYPVEMLELDMTLDSDLGIDSIKKVEIFSTLKDTLPNIRPIKSEHMGNLKTLRNIVDFISNNGSSRLSSEANKKETKSEKASSDYSTALISLISDKTGYPVEMLELDMTLDSDLGIDSIKKVEIFSALKDALPGIAPIKSEHMGNLKTLGDIVRFLKNNGETETGENKNSVKSTDSETNIKEQSQRQNDNSIHRLTLKTAALNGNRERFNVKKDSEIWITDDGTALSLQIEKQLISMGYHARIIPLENPLQEIKNEKPLAGLIIIAPPKNGSDRFLKNSFKLLKISGPELKKSSENGHTIFLTVSRLDGTFGLAGIDCENEPLSGGLAGLSKTAGHEWPEIRCKAIDLDPAFSSVEKAAGEIVDEMFTEGPVEVGISSSGRCTIELSSSKNNGNTKSFPLGKNDVLIITGGARGVTARCAIEIAKNMSDRNGPILVLLGRSPLPSPEPQWLKALNDESEIKKEMMHRSNVKLSPIQLRDQYLKVIAGREISSTLSEIETGGSRVYYRSVDIRDFDELKKQIDDIKTSIGPIKGIIHGAGVIADKLIKDKTEDEFDLVYSTKVTGLRNLLKLLNDDDLKLIVMFSSSTGRYGRSGQVDYAVANEVLNKLARQQAKLRPKSKVLSLNWGPWDGGMVTSSLKKIFENEGVGLIELSFGARFLIREIMSNDENPPVEIVALGEKSDRKTGGATSVSFERILRIEDYPFLKSHVIDSNAVLPVSMIIEWLAHGAMLQNPGMNFHGFNNLRIAKGLILGRDKDCSFKILTGNPSADNNEYVIPAELRSSFEGKNYNLNAYADVILSESVKSPEKVETGHTGYSPYPHPYSDIYGRFLFHGSDFHGIEKIEGYSTDGKLSGISGIAKTSPKPSSWLKQPLRNSWIADPLIIDTAFQMMILWCIEKYGIPSLPCYIGSYRQFRQYPRQSVKITARITECSENRAVSDIEFADEKGILVARIENYECIIESLLKKAFLNNSLEEKALL